MARTLVTGNILRSGSIPTTALGGGVVTSSLQIVASLPTGSLSSSAQVNYPDISNIPGGIASSSTQIKNYLPVDSVSSSAQVTAFLPTGTVSSSTQLPSGIASSSAQVTAYLPTGTVSSSGQVSYTGLSNVPSGIASSSGQIKDYLPVNTVSSSQQVTTFLPANTVSSSGQISLSSISGTTFSNNDFTFPLNVTVNGLLTATSQSVIFITSSQLNVGSNDIVLNTTEQLRFGGLTVFDSGSANQSGSLFWDSLNNVWLYVHAGTSNTSSILITGPENTEVLGSEAFLTQNRVPKAGVNGDHIVDSQISDNGTTVGMTGNLSVTGSVSAGSYTGSLSGSSVVASTLTGTLQTAAQTNVTSVGTLSSLTVSGNTNLATTSGNVGIGTTNPAYILQVASTGSTPVAITSTSTGSAQGVYLYLSNTGFIGRSGRLYANTSNHLVISSDTTNSIIGDIIFGVGSSYTEAMRINGSGNVGINTNTPTARLEISGSNTQGIIHLKSPTTQAAFFVSASGNVGIGITDPFNRLEIASGSFRAYSIANQYTLVNIDSSSSAVSPMSEGGIMELNAGDLHLRSFWGVSVDINGGNLGDSMNAPQARIANTTSFTVNKRSSTSAFTNLFTIRNSGNVGIGTTGPNAKLEVVGRTISTNLVVGAYGTLNDTTGTSQTLQFGNYSAGAFIASSADAYIYKTSTVFSGLSAQTLIFQTRSDTDGGGFAWVAGSTPAVKMYMNSSGNVGIGTTNPSGTGTNLEIKGVTNDATVKVTGNTAGNAYLQLSAGSSANAYINSVGSGYLAIGANGAASNAMTILSSGNVGIGTTSPNLSAGAAGSTIVTISTSTSARNAVLELNGARTDNGGYTGYVRFFNNLAASPLADIQAIRAGADTTGSLAFATTNVERMRIDSSGNVGIGTTNAAYRMTVKGSAVSTFPIALTNQNNALIAGFYETGGNGGQMYLYTSAGGQNVKLSAVDASYISGSNVGIGTNNPSTTFHVNGNARITGNTYTNTVNGTSHFKGDIASNLGSGESGYWCITQNTGNTGEPASQLIVDVVSSSWTVWNLCRVVIEKKYQSSTVNVTITGYYNTTVVVSVVTVTVGGTNYLAIKHTGGDPGLVVSALQYGVDLSSAFYTKSGTVVTTHASYP